MHIKADTSQVLQLIMRMSIRKVAQTTSGSKKGQKKKWDKNPPNDKETLTEKSCRMSPKSDASTTRSWVTLLRIAKR